jgi:DNA (cytosine-5)-methyltransferase 1
MSWLYSQALVEEYLGDNFSDGEQSVPLNGSHTQLAYLPPDKMTEFSRLSRSGMTFKPLTETLGMELLTLYLAAFPVPTLALQDGEQDLMEKAHQCGITWRGWLAKFDQDSYSWKIAQCSFIEESGESLETFPASGMTRDGLLWEQTRLERPTKGTERGLWRTPDTGGGGHLDYSKKARIIGRMDNPSKSDWWIK